MAATEGTFHAVVPEISEPSLRASGGAGTSSAATDAAGLPVQTAASPTAPQSAGSPTAAAAAADGGWFSLGGLAIVLAVLLIGIAAVGWFFTRSEEVKPRPAVTDDLSTFANRAGSEFESLLERRRRARKNSAGATATPPASATPDAVVTAATPAAALAAAPAAAPAAPAPVAASAAPAPTVPAPVAAPAAPAPTVPAPAAAAADVSPAVAANPEAVTVPITPASMAANASYHATAPAESLYERVQRETVLSIDALDVPGSHGEVDLPLEV